MSRDAQAATARGFGCGHLGESWASGGGGEGPRDPSSLEVEREEQEAATKGERPRHRNAGGTCACVGGDFGVAQRRQGNPDPLQLAMASGTGGSWGHHPAQTAAPTVKAESGTRACLYLEGLGGRVEGWADLGSCPWRVRTLEEWGWVRRATPAREEET